VETLCILLMHLYMATFYFSCGGGNDTKINCAAGTYNNETGSSSILACVACEAGFYSTAGAAYCTVCPAGSACPSPLFCKYSLLLKFGRRCLLHCLSGSLSLSITSILSVLPVTKVRQALLTALSVRQAQPVHHLYSVSTPCY